MFRIQQKELSTLVANAGLTAGKAQIKDAYAKVEVKVKGSTLSLFTTNGFSMSLQKFTVESQQDLTVLVDHKIFSQMVKMMQKEEVIEVGVEGNNLVLSGMIKLIVPGEIGDYPMDYVKAIKGILPVVKGIFPAYDAGKISTIGKIKGTSDLPTIMRISPRDLKATVIELVDGDKWECLALIMPLKGTEDREIDLAKYI